MYAKNSNSTPDTVKVQADRGSLRLQFSIRYNPIFGDKRKYQPLGMKDTPDNRAKAEAIAYRIENDLLHPDWAQLFDPTFAKYGLKSQYAALQLAAPIPEAETEITVGAMWEDYLIWKQPYLQPTTFVIFQTTLANALKGLVWNKKNGTFLDTENSLWEIPLNAEAGVFISELLLGAKNKALLTSGLSEAFTRLQSQGKTKLTKNPFILENKTENKTDKYKPIVDADGTEREWWQFEDTETNPEERDRRAFTKDERDTIIKAFYESDKAAARQAAPLIEFLFLTGCRSGEAFALRWYDIKLEKGYIFFYKSYSTRLKAYQRTKDGVDRLFRVYSKLNDFLTKIKPDNAQPNDLVFTKLNGKSWDSSALGKIWNKPNAWESADGVKQRGIGVVTQLAESKAISCYLSPYHTRHTFITLQARHKGIDLLLLATACGNSVDMIQRHYLGINEEASLANI